MHSISIILTGFKFIKLHTLTLATHSYVLLLIQSTCTIYNVISNVNRSFHNKLFHYTCNTTTVCVVLEFPHPIPPMFYAAFHFNLGLYQR